MRKYIYFDPEVVLIFGLDISFVSDPCLLLVNIADLWYARVYTLSRVTNVVEQ
jgi:hypothetical protein